MKILVLGAGGMLGTDVTNLLQESHQVFSYSRNDLDITQESSCQKTIGLLQPDLVINCAAYTKVDECEANSATAFLVNGEAVKNVAMACAQFQARLFQISTDYVFDGTKSSPYNEDDPPNPVNVYGLSKLKGEENARLAPNFLIIRTSWLFGANGPNFVETIIRLAETWDELTVVNDQRGSPTYTKDLAGAISLLAERDVNGIINVTNSNSCSWYDFARMILDLTGSKTPIAPIKTSDFKRPANRPHYSVLDNSRYSALSGGGLRPWQAALKDYLGGCPRTGIVARKWRNEAKYSRI